jgi:hypothetical protein
MSWNRKGRHAYFYRSIRLGDRVVKEYLGRGEEAEEAAQRIEERRKTRQSQREARIDELARLAVAEQHLRDFHELVNVLVRATLLAAEYHEHRGQWRKRRQHGKSKVKEKG